MRLRKRGILSYQKVEFVSQQILSPFDDRLEAQDDTAAEFQYLQTLCKWSWRLQRS